jgi:hypothetical protein
MNATDALLAPTSLIFVVVFAGSAVYYLGGENVVPRWFSRLGLGLKKPATPTQRAASVMLCLVFIALAEWAVLANLNGPAPLPTILWAEQLAALAWLVYLSMRWRKRGHVRRT